MNVMNIVLKEPRLCKVAVSRAWPWSAVKTGQTRTGLIPKNEGEDTRKGSFDAIKATTEEPFDKQLFFNNIFLFF